jgi:hypothetical protein
MPRAPSHSLSGQKPARPSEKNRINPRRFDHLLGPACPAPIRTPAQTAAWVASLSSAQRQALIDLENGCARFAHLLGPVASGRGK